MKVLLLAASCASLVSCVVPMHTAQPATPQRPTVSSNTATTARGTLELESGFRADPGSVYDFPSTLKYGSGEATEVFLGWSPLVFLERSGDDEVGAGDIAVGLRHRFLEEDARFPSFAVQSFVKLPTADEDEGLGTGELDAGFAGIATRRTPQFDLTGFYELGLVGDPTGGTNVAHTLTAAASVPVVDRYGAFGELAGIFRPEVDENQLLAILGMTYTLSPAAIFDVGIVVGLSSDAPDFQLVVGITQNFGRLFGAR